MPSLLRHSTFPSAITESTTQSYSVPSPQKRQKMSLTQTYYLAHTARAKLSKEAARADHNLRLLVGHANLLDGLMLDLADAEREQESWFNESVKATKESEEPKHIQWADSMPTVVEDYEEESSDDESEASDDEEEISYSLAPLRRVPSPPSIITTTEMDIDSDEEEDNDEEDEEELALHRTPSRSPPELLHESDSDSEDDDSMPPSPPHTLDSYSEKQRQASFFGKAQSASHSPEADFYEEGYYLPQRQSVSVY
ncbi:hypothetical protein MMC34_001790 [Xylographa carneopallida]|nr:hypothetical protein [Xylographa carneopallida]